MGLVEKIERIVAIASEKGLNDEFILARDHHPEWTNKRTGEVTAEYVEWLAGVTNPVGAVALGESEPVHSFVALTADEAVDGLLKIMEGLS